MPKGPDRRKRPADAIGRAVLIATLLIAGCHELPRETKAAGEQCSPDAEVVTDHAKCLALAQGADTVVNMNPDGSCRVCSDLAVPSPSPSS